MTRIGLHRLPADSFPFTIEAIARRTGEVVWTAAVYVPGALKVPGLAEQHGPVKMRVTFADGSIQESW